MLANNYFPYIKTYPLRWRLIRDRQPPFQINNDVSVQNQSPNSLNTNLRDPLSEMFVYDYSGC